MIGIALATSILAAVLGLVLFQHEIEALLRRFARWVRPPLETPTSLPIERIARNARRLHTELADLAPGTPMVRRVGLARAYDDLLAHACRSLGVPDTLSELSPGVDREAERLHVESELEAAGLRLTA